MSSTSRSPADSHKPLDAALVSAIAAGSWEKVAELLNRGVSDASHRWAVKVAGQSLEMAALARFILPYSTVEQLEILLSEVVKRGQWGTVGQLLKRGVGDKEQRAWALQQAGQRAKDPHLATLIVPWCDVEQVEPLLKTAVDRGLFQSVSLLLERGVSESLQRLVVDEASHRAYDNPYTLAIFRYCVNDQLEPVLRRSMKRGMWSCVGGLLQHTAISDKLRTWVVETALGSICSKSFSSTQLSRENSVAEFVKPAQGSDLSDILQHCSDSQLEAVLKVTVQKELWLCVGHLLQREMKIAAGKKSSVENLPELASIGASCGRYSPEDIFACSPGDSGSHLLQDFPLRDTEASALHSWAVRECFKRGSEADIIDHILPFCTELELVSCLNCLIKRKMWTVAVTMILHPCFTEPKRQDLFVKASKSADEDCLIREVLPKCSSNYADEVLPVLVKRGFWRAASVFLNPPMLTPPSLQRVKKDQQGGIRDTLKKMVAEEAILCADPCHLSLILPLCIAGQFRPLFLTAIKRHRWSAVTVLLSLPHGETEPSVGGTDPHDQLHGVRCDYKWVNDYDLAWAFEEVSKVASENVLITNVLMKCPRKNVDAVLDIILNRKLWKAVAILIHQQDLSATQLGRVFEVVCKARSLEEMFLIHDLDVGRFCPEANLHSVLVSLVERGYWNAATRLLQCQEFHADDRGWVLQKASQRAKEVHVLRVLNGGPSGCLHFVLHNLLQRCLWEAVQVLLARSQGTAGWESLCALAMENASKKASEAVLLQLHCYCPMGSAEYVMESLLKRSLWKPIQQLLKKHRVNVFLRCSIAEEASRKVDDEMVLADIVSYCPTSHVESALSIIVKRKRWRAASCLLSRYISVTVRMHVVKESLRHYRASSSESSGNGDIRRLIMGLSIEHLDQVLAGLVCLQQWHYIRLLLQLVGCDSLVETGRDRHVCLAATDDFGTTLLHIMGASCLPCTVSTLVDKGADPLKSNVYGQTLLCISVNSEKYPERMVAECLKLGLSTQQATLIRQAQDKGIVKIELCSTPSPTAIPGQHPVYAYINRLLFQGISMTSPLECAILRGSTVLVNALFESGVCSHVELSAIYIKTIMELPSNAPDTAREVCACLEKMVNSVRSLKSACRLVASHCIGVGNLDREARVKELPIPKELQDYIQFSDLHEQLIMNSGTSFQPAFDEAVGCYLDSDYPVFKRTYILNPSLYYHNFLTTFGLLY